MAGQSSRGAGVPLGGEQTPQVSPGAPEAGFAEIDVIAPRESRHFFPVPDT